MAPRITTWPGMARPMGGSEIASARYRESSAHRRRWTDGHRGHGDNSTLRPRRQDDDCAMPTSGSLDTSARTGSRPILTGTAASRIRIPRISTARIPRSTTVSQAIGPMGLPRRACRQSWQRCRTRRPPHHQRHLCICPVPKTHRAVHRTVITVATRARPFTAHPSVGQSHAVIRPGSAYATNPVKVRGHRTNPGLGFGTSLDRAMGNYARPTSSRTSR